MNIQAFRILYNYLRFHGKNNKVVDLGRIHTSATIEKSVFGNRSSAARNSSVVSSVLGRYTSVGRNSKITHSDIGSFCSISWDCTINAVSHPMDGLTTHAFPYVPSLGGFVDARTQHHERVQIGNDVWIGAQVIIMPGIRIQDGAVIGAGAIVTRDIEAYEVVVSSPAKHLKWRFEKEIREKLLALQWWNWSDDKIGKNISIFQKPISLKDLD